MVEYQSTALDRTFSALADPTRRKLIAKLTGRSRSVGELAHDVPMSLQAVIKHLDVLAEAGLVTRKKTGRTVACTLAVAPLDRAAAWLDVQKQAWHGRLDRLDDYLRSLQGAPDETER